eukprot:14333907-Ditylum_brightwellii.AAC.1
MQFHALILHPLPPNHKDSISDTVKHQLQMFRAGKAHELLDNAYNVKSLTPGEKSAEASANPIPPDAAAQGAADAGN